MLPTSCVPLSRRARLNIDDHSSFAKSDGRAWRGRSDRDGRVVDKHGLRAIEAPNGSAWRDPNRPFLLVPARIAATVPRSVRD